MDANPGTKSTIGGGLVVLACAAFFGSLLYFVVRPRGPAVSPTGAPTAEASASPEAIATVAPSAGVPTGGSLTGADDPPTRTTATDERREPRTRGPVGTANIGGAAVSGGNVANASAVVAGMAAGFRRCYNKGLLEDPNMKGSIRVTAKIGPNGEVISASPSASGLSGTVASCVTARVSSAQFAPPEGGGATIVIPVTFVSQ
jgi:hypothetical protein